MRVRDTWVQMTKATPNIAISEYIIALNVAIAALYAQKVALIVERKWIRRKLMNWISVKERLPEPDSTDYVLVCCTMKVTSKIDYVNAVTMAFVCEEGFVDVELDEVITEGVTHWMPLPEPPKEEK